MIRESSRRRRTVELAGVTLLALVALASLWSVIVAPRQSVLVEDERDYLRAAVHLARDGVLSHAPIGEPSPRPDAYREPGYPFAIAALWRLAGTPLPADEEAFARSAGSARRAERATRALNVSLLLIAAGAVAIGARRAGAGVPGAALAAFAVSVSPALGRAATALASENLAAPLVSLAGAALVARVAGGGARWIVVAGIAAGLAPLARGATIVLLPAVMLVLGLTGYGRSRRERALSVALFAALAFAPSALWVARNHALTGHAVLADRGGAVLWIRAELDRQIAEEGLAPALLEWTPLEAARRAREIEFPDSRIGAYQWTGEGNFFTRAIRRWQADRAVAEDPVAADRSLARASRRAFIERPGEHLRATVAVAWRGLFAERSPTWLLPIDLTLVLNVGLALATLVALGQAVRRRDPRPWTLAALPLVLFAAHALGTEFLPRFSVPSLPLVWAAALAAFGRRSPPAPKGPGP